MPETKLSAKPNEVAVTLWDKYYKERIKHTSDKWLTLRGLKERWLYDPTKEPKAFRSVMINGFDMDQSFREWLRNEINQDHLEKGVLRECIVLLKNHKSRIAWRSNFLTISAAIMVVLTTMTGLLHLPYVGVTIIVAAFTFFIISERTMLNDLQSAADELIAIIEMEISETRS